MNTQKLKRLLRSDIIGLSLMDVILMSVLVFFIITIQSCSEHRKKEDSKEIAEKHNDTKFNKSEERDAQFVVDAANMHMECDMLSDSVAHLSSEEQVKKLASQISSYHTQALKELKVLAAAKLITVPVTSDKAYDVITKLPESRDIDINKIYVKQMLAVHEDFIKRFEKAANSAEDAEIRSWSDSQLRNLRKLADAIINTQQESDKEK